MPRLVIASLSETMSSTDNISLWIEPAQRVRGPQVCVTCNTNIAYTWWGDVLYLFLICVHYDHGGTLYLFCLMAVHDDDLSHFLRLYFLFSTQTKILTFSKELGEEKSDKLPLP